MRCSLLQTDEQMHAPLYCVHAVALIYFNVNLVARDTAFIYLLSISRHLHADKIWLIYLSLAFVNSKHRDCPQTESTH